MYREFLDFSERVLDHNDRSQDALLTRIRRNLKNLESKGFSWKYISFSFKTQWGLDLKIIFALLVMQIFFLFLTCLCPQKECNWLNWVTLLLCLLSIVVPGIFILIGNSELRKIQKELNESLENLQATYHIPQEMLDELNYLIPVDINTTNKNK